MMMPNQREAIRGRCLGQLVSVATLVADVPNLGVILRPLNRMQARKLSSVSGQTRIGTRPILGFRLARVCVADLEDCVKGTLASPVAQYVWRAERNVYYRDPMAFQASLEVPTPERLDDADRCGRNRNGADSRERLAGGVR